MGESEATILKQARMEHGPIPDRIVNAPELEMGLEFTYDAFQRLNTERPVGMGPGPIPWSAIDRFAFRYELDEDEQSDLEFLIGKMDETYLKHMQKKMEAKQEFDRSAAANKRQPLGAKIREKGGR